MSRLLEHIQAQPKAVRNHIAVLIAALVVLTCALVWLPTVPVRIATIATTLNNAREEVLPDIPADDTVVPEERARTASETARELLDARSVESSTTTTLGAENSIEATGTTLTE